MTELKTTAARMVAEARARIEEIDTADLIARADDACAHLRDGFQDWEAQGGPVERPEG